MDERIPFGFSEDRIEYCFALLRAGSVKAYEDGDGHSPASDANRSHSAVFSLSSRIASVVLVLSAAVLVLSAAVLVLSAAVLRLEIGGNPKKEAAFKRISSNR